MHKEPPAAILEADCNPRIRRGPPMRKAVVVVIAAILIGVFASAAQAAETKVSVEPGLDQTTFLLPINECGSLCGEDAGDYCPDYRPDPAADIPGGLESVPC